MSGDLLGTWDMVAWYNEDARDGRHYPLGGAATDRINYTPDGHVFVALSAANRTAFATDDPFGGTAQETTLAMTSHITCSGRYSRDGDEVLHHVAQASCPNWVGRTQRRHVELGPKDTMTLSAEGALFNRRTVTAYVHWRRADATI